MFALRRIEWPGGDWIGLSHRDGRLDTVFDAEGEILRLERDAHGRVAAVADRYRRHVEYGYDPRGRLARVRDLAGNYWSHEYDAADRLTAALGVDGEPYLTVGYDSSGRVALSVGERSFAFEYERDFTAVADRLSGERNVFQRAANGTVVGFSSTSGVAWQIDLDDAGRVGTLSMSDAAARLADDGPDAFRPADIVPEDRHSGAPWSRVIRFGYSSGGIATTEVASAAGIERRDYRYDDQGRLALSWSSTDGIPPLQVDYRDGTALRSGSDTVFEYRTGPYGAVAVGNGRTRIAVERDRHGDVLAFRSGAGVVFFARDGLGRIVAVRHMDRTGARYFLDDLGHRTLAEYTTERRPGPCRGVGRGACGIGPAGGPG